MTITTKIIADSIGENSGVRLTTFRVYAPLSVCAELKSVDAMSVTTCYNPDTLSALLAKTIDETDMSVPAIWSLDNPTTNRVTLTEEASILADMVHRDIVAAIVDKSNELIDLQVARRDIARILAPWIPGKAVCTATDWSNIVNQVKHCDSHRVQYIIYQFLLSLTNSTPKQLSNNAWHMPYVYTGSHVGSDDYALDVALQSAYHCCNYGDEHEKHSYSSEKREAARKLVSTGRLDILEHQAKALTRINTRYGKLRAWKSARVKMEDLARATDKTYRNIPQLEQELRNCMEKLGILTKSIVEDSVGPSVSFPSELRGLEYILKAT